MKINRQQLSSGTILGNRYSVVRALGQGGMAHVYLAEDLKTNNYVALKIMRDELSDDPEFIRRFATEARAAASLDHPNIVAVLDYGQDNDIRYIVQEYVEGKTLKDLIREQGALDYHLAVPLMIQISLALEHAHKRGVIHRDMKPQNVMITADMVAKVTDFGIARTSNANTITLTGGVAFGSVHYFSPEQARGGHVTGQSDLYSLGIILYEMLTGELPFDGESSVAVAIKQLQEMPNPPSHYLSSLPRSLDNIVFKAIQKSPQNRYESARIFVNELDAFMKNPNGRYGVVKGNANQISASSALGAQARGSNYNKLQEVEKSITKRKKSQNRDTVGVVIIVVLAVALLFGAFIWLYRNILGKDQTIEQADFILEDYTGRNIEEVARELEENYNLVFGEDYIVEWVENDVTKGNIFNQDPEPNQKFFRGKDKLTFKVSAGKDVSYVPDVTGKTQAEAEQILISAGYGVIITKESSLEFDEDQVIRTVPIAGSTLPLGESVHVYVAGGKTTTIVPRIIGYSWADAVDILDGANLKMGSATGYDGSVPKEDRIIMMQSPEANSEVRAGASVSVTYGTSKQYNDYLNPTESTRSDITMPVFVGSTWDKTYS
ncbi:MAG TPA: Stk1 family PASTA domain-containing Ser/Thr kinase, partial [Candidatus Eisenbacteria bacterium]|nr:Stk1 family PASTA domain-containing Ser/Thr kinase [Candidatus Eisenbacteria bacterium]